MGLRAMEYMGGIVPALRAMPQPVIAAIKGPAYGGGMCLSLGADVRLAGRSAVFCGAGITNGLTGCELGVSWLLPRAVGTSRSNEILLTGRRSEPRRPSGSGSSPRSWTTTRCSTRRWPWPCTSARSARSA